ncbi:AMP-binding protein [Blastochloris viridis]|uniref:2-succinylbenzoate--CoA ligase n=1 Tax=Blastochloris viridis TaxID=1079 RepID=A0A0H5BE22_BLAVI|nr:AMP-binding protein [Blastochloris viridis]ALK08133.1 putative sulfoacetate--CoA ligase [Blastochloris viridis]BAR98601.1 O-succinylbenzoic acid--CoA ligase [Blastochloris viridis]CUU44055.1 2-succinylbenzoate--CoA ligase [Blastochloris viridis]
MMDAVLAQGSLLAPLRLRPNDGALLPGWPRTRVLDWVDGESAQIGELDGEIIAMPLANDGPSLLALLLIGACGGAALPLAPEATEREQASAMARAGAGRRLVPGERPRLIGPPGQARLRPGDVVLATSASTGAAKLVPRSAASLIAEGQRYADLLRLGGGAHILVPAPLVHAYALGWFAACVVGGWCADPLPPAALGAIAAAMAQGADWTVMTPALARLLAARPGRGTAARCRVMVGAGPVTAELDRAFRDRFAVGLARNYGSTETGAVLSGFEELPPGCVGTPMPGATIRIIDHQGVAAATGTPGLIEVLTPAGWHAMADVAVADGEGRVTILGRHSAALRRGDRWIAPLEVEQHLAAFPGLRALRVAKSTPAAGGRDRLVAELWPTDPASFDRAAFSAFAEATLQPAMRPDDVRVRTVLTRTDGGKIAAPAVWRRGPPDRVAAAARAYKRSELAFALDAAGVLGALDGNNTTDAIAADLGLDPGLLELLLRLAGQFGLVEPAGAGPAPPHRPTALEAQLSAVVVTRQHLLELMRSGFAGRRDAFADPALTASYLDAMNGAAVAFRVRFGLRQLGLPPGARLLEVSAGPGRYGKAAGDRVVSALWAVGPAACPTGPAAAPPAGGPFDAIVLFNGLRWVPDRLAELAATLSAGGTLLIDELFLEDDDASAEFALDWITHGGPAFLTLAELTAALADLGLEVEVKAVPRSTAADTIQARLVLARHPPA